MDPTRRSTGWVALIGTLAITAYAVLAALQIIVFTPLAAVPGHTLNEIRAEMAAAGEAPGDAGVLIILGIGVAIAVTVAVLVIRTHGRPVLAALLFLAVLTMGAPAFFIASFGPGMSLSDTFMVSGGVTLYGVAPFYIVSALAGMACIVLGISAAIRPHPVAVTI
ncbi:hypothetical protein [Microbacterium sp. A84]|uniref:hypothetical protein n=1 Tax=Microbacterium sp. A84 TaxID=3450715 RepID=UPI003F426589